jgi:hypothetical protein
MTFQPLDFNKIKQNLDGVSEVLNFHEMQRTSFVDVNATIERQPIALSFGSYEYKDVYYPIPMGSYGDFSCIVGASKSMKTFLKSAMVACYIGGQAQSYFPDMKGHDTEGKYILDFDTEQSLFHTQKVSKRVCEMVGANSEMYKPFMLRDKEAKIRLQFIEWMIMESEYKNKIGLVSIDGSADLLDNVNDLDVSNQVVQKLMTWSKQANCHIITIIHRNHGSMKPTGHLGSSLLKKAESVIFVDKDGNDVKVTPEYTRNFPFEEFSFTLNKNFLPIQNGSLF